MGGNIVMNKERLVEVLLNIVREEFSDIEIKDLNDELRDNGIDSVKVIKLIIQIEERFKFEFDDEDLIIDNFKSLNTLADFLTRKLEEQK